MCCVVTGTKEEKQEEASETSKTRSRRWGRDEAETRFTRTAMVNDQWYNFAHRSKTFLMYDQKPSGNNIDE